MQMNFPLSDKRVGQMRSRLVLLIAVVLLPSPVYGGPVGMILRVGGQAELIRASATQEALPGEIKVAEKEDGGKSPVRSLGGSRR